MICLSALAVPPLLGSRCLMSEGNITVDARRLLLQHLHLHTDFNTRPPLFTCHTVNLDNGLHIKTLFFYRCFCNLQHFLVSLFRILFAKMSAWMNWWLVHGVPRLLPNVWDRLQPLVTSIAVTENGWTDVCYCFATVHQSKSPICENLLGKLEAFW